MTTRDTAISAEFEQTLTLLGTLLQAVNDLDEPHDSLANIQSIVRELQSRPNLQELPGMMLKVYKEISEALSGIRATRQTIQNHSLERLKDTHERITEVSSTTENAALEMMNGLDRSLALIDTLEKGGATGADAYQALRDEVNALYSHLQFQDIIAQQLHGVTALLAEIENRMQVVATLFDEAGSESGIARLGAITAVHEDTYNPDAKFGDSSERQALADAAFQSARAPA